MHVDSEVETTTTVVIVINVGQKRGCGIIGLEVAGERNRWGDGQAVSANIELVGVDSYGTLKQTGIKT